ncbi:response regulator [candidate division KSB1 bacterium]|nr:response regulator [candidate division KSB1 bacterium]
MKAMVVDDERDVELLFRQYFRKEIQQKIIEFMFAFSGEEALELLHAMKQPPNVMLILSDINMPGMNGLELLQMVKKEFPLIRVSMITAYSNQYYERAMECGAENYYTKPLDFRALKREILKECNDEEN